MPQTIEQPPVTAQRARPRPSFRRRLAVSILRFAIVVAIAAGISGGWYLARKGFGGRTRARIVEELHRVGIEASIGHLTLNPFRGLVARNVRLFSYHDRTTTLAFISEIALDINYAAFFHKQPFLNAVEIRNAEVTLPLKGPQGKTEQPQLRKFRAYILFPPDQIFVSQAEGIFCGVRVSATGQLIKRPDYKPSPPLSEEERQQRMSILRRIIRELQRFNFPEGPPLLQVKFSGDLADLENGHAEASLQARSLRRQGYEMRNLAADAEWADQTLKISRCQWSDRLGDFAATATWSRQDESATFQARSSLDLKSLLDAADAGKALEDATFNSPPVIDISGSGDFKGEHPKFKLIGHVMVSNLSYKNLPLSDCRAEFSWDGERTWLRDIHIRHPTGDLRAEMFETPDEFRLNIDGPIAPGELRPFVSPEMEEFLNEWECARPPVIQLAIRGKDRHPESWRGDGSISLDRTRFRGQWMNSASAKVHFADGAVTYENFRVVRDEGVGTGNFTYDFAKHEVRISNVKANLRPVEAAVWIDPDLPKTVSPYKFHQPPSITANGVYQFRGQKGTKLDINVDAPTGMDYVFLGKTLPFHKISGRLLFTDDRLQIVDLRGNLFSGNVRGNADISLAHGDQHYRAKLTVDSVDFPRLTDLYWNYKTAHGLLSGTYDFTGIGDNARLMQGTGKLNVANGDVFAIPIFGPISGILNGILPGTAGYSIAHEATADFTVNNAVIHTNNLEIAGKMFSIIGHGDIHFMDDKLDFDIGINPKGASVILAPVYKLFEYKGEGSLKNPNWHPKAF